ncbi:helix-turn-helix transcriptional regulator [Namhaeicola litoreus]|uniref:Helix-turn-helix transcriptional regulator n=1 Tax=Namhaeicola litoreus TaxID=1052145 RepID=A0ABW3Y2G3_9FLAO
MKYPTQSIQPYIDNEIEYHADTCLPLIDAVSRNKVKFNALARFTYPGRRLTEQTFGLNSVGYWDANEPQDWGLDWHRNEGVEIHFLESGTMPYSQENKHTILSPNQLTITRPWEIHKVGNPKINMGKFYWVILDVGIRRPHEKWKWPDWIILTPEDLEKLTKLLRHNNRSVWDGNKKIRNCFLRIGQTVDADKNGSNASMVRILINELLHLLLDLIDRQDIDLNESLTDSLHSVKHFLNELDSNLFEDWTIEKMADSAGMGTTRFTHHCKQLTNLTPMRYLMMKRLELSKYSLLYHKKQSITDIAYKCGFSTSQYFSTVFKKHEKCTPQEFRERVMDELTI